MKTTDKKSSAWVIRWAAIGAAVAVTLGAGGLVGVDAAPAEGDELPAFIPVDPIRVWDSRTEEPGPMSDGTTGLYGDVVSQLDLNDVLYGTKADGGYAWDYVVDAVVINVTIPGGTIVFDGYVSVTPSSCAGTPAVDGGKSVDPWEFLPCYSKIYDDPETAFDTFPYAPTKTSAVNWKADRVEPGYVSVAPSVANMITVPLGEYGTDGQGKLDFVMPFIFDFDEALDPVADIVVDLVGFYSTGVSRESFS